MLIRRVFVDPLLQQITDDEMPPHFSGFKEVFLRVLALVARKAVMEMVKRKIVVGRKLGEFKYTGM
jgi:hypothetical protein